MMRASIALMIFGALALGGCDGGSSSDGGGGDGDGGSDGSGGSCTDLCDHVEELCGTRPPECENQCETLTASQRQCVNDASSCEEFQGCATVGGDGGTGGGGEDAGGGGGGTTVSGCAGAACPYGECSTTEQCSTYEEMGFDWSDSSEVCRNGPGQFCIDVEGSFYRVECDESGIPIKRDCVDGCNYDHNDECAYCAEDGPCGSS